MQRVLLIIAAALIAGSAFAQLRTIPEEAKRGELRHLQDMLVIIDGVPQRLAPGAQIRDASNRIVVPAALAAGADVRYLVNGEGLVRQIWILTPEEAAKR